MKKKKTPSGIRNLLINLSVSLATLTILTLIYVIVFRSFERGMEGYKRLSQHDMKKFDYGPLSPAEIVQLGIVHKKAEAPTTSYLTYPEKKATGKYRIGIFGCSHVNGNEVPHGLDLSAQLQEMYRENGRNEIEILNFGVSSYGMGQAYHLWKLLAHRYDLDQVIFYVMHFHIARDQSFMIHGDRYGPVHCRYIWKNNALERIPVEGSTVRESSDHYYSAFTPWKYIKYEYKTPVPFRAILPKGRELSPHPFYYHPNPQQEGMQLYTAFFDSVARGSKRLLLFMGSRELGNFVKDMSEEVDTLRYPNHKLIQKYNYFYKAENHHPTTLGHEQIATQLYRHLNDSIGFSYRLLRHGELPPHRLRKTKLSVKGRLEKCYLAIDGKELSTFYVKKKQKRWEVSSYNYSGKIKSILDFSQSSISQAIRFAPLGFPMGKRQKLFLSFRLGGERVKRPFAQISPLNQKFGTLTRVVKNLEGKGWQVKLFSRNEHELEVFIKTTQKVSEVQILAGNKPILKAKQIKRKGDSRKVFYFEPVIGPWMYPRGSRQQRVRLKNIAPQGTIDLVNLYQGGDSASFPIRTYTIQTLDPSEVK